MLPADRRVPHECREKPLPQTRRRDTPPMAAVEPRAHNPAAPPPPPPQCAAPPGGAGEEGEESERREVGDARGEKPQDTPARGGDAAPGGAGAGPAPGAAAGVRPAGVDLEGTMKQHAHAVHVAAETAKQLREVLKCERGSELTRRDVVHAYGLGLRMTEAIDSLTGLASIVSRLAMAEQMKKQQALQQTLLAQQAAQQQAGANTKNMYETVHRIELDVVKRRRIEEDVERECFLCKTKETPEWRRLGTGQRICNACGLRNKYRPASKGKHAGDSGPAAGAQADAGDIQFGDIAFADGSALPEPPADAPAVHPVGSRADAGDAKVDHTHETSADDGSGVAKAPLDVNLAVP